MASVLQTIKAVTSEGYLSNYLRDWLNKIERDLSSVSSESLPVGTDTQTLRYNGTTIESTSDMVIDASGNVGIGTTNPLERLDVSGGVSRFPNNVAPTNEGDAAAYFGKFGGSAFMSNQFNLTFRTASTERMRIDSSGYALIGYSSSNGAYKLQVNSQIFATNSTIATSDARFKTNVLDISTGMDVISALRPVSFDWKQGEGHNFVEHRDLGFIAQEAESALSGKEYIQGVVKDVGSFKGMAYDKLIPILVKALQEQQADIDSLTTRIESLEV